jgi:hypothetical protein
MSDHKDTNPKDRCATNRIDLSLFPPSARAYGALGMTEGDLKYGGYNYRVAGVKASVYYAAAGRHLDRWFNGEDVDPKTKVPHLASAIACIAILIDGTEQSNLNDDRPPKQSCGLYERLEAAVDHLRSTFPRASERYTNNNAPFVSPVEEILSSHHRAGEASGSDVDGCCAAGDRATDTSDPYWGYEICCGGGP